MGGLSFLRDCKQCLHLNQRELSADVLTAADADPASQEKRGGEHLHRKPYLQCPFELAQAAISVSRAARAHGLVQRLHKAG